MTVTKIEQILNEPFFNGMVCYKTVSTSGFPTFVSSVGRAMDCKRVSHWSAGIHRSLVNSFSDEFVGFTMFLYEHFSIPVNPLVDNLTKLLELVYSPMSIGLTFSSAMSKFIVQPRRLVDRHLT